MRTLDRSEPIMGVAVCAVGRVCRAIGGAVLWRRTHFEINCDQQRVNTGRGIVVLWRSASESKETSVAKKMVPAPQRPPRLDVRSRT